MLYFNQVWGLFFYLVNLGLLKTLKEMSRKGEPPPRPVADPSRSVADIVRWGCKAADLDGKTPGLPKEGSPVFICRLEGWIRFGPGPPSLPTYPTFQPPLRRASPKAGHLKKDGGGKENAKVKSKKSKRNEMGPDRRNNFL